MHSAYDEPVDPYGDDDRPTERVPLPPAEPFRLWELRPDAGWAPEFNLTGYHVEAVDGSIGKVGLATYATDASYLTVETGPWVFGRTLVVPAGLVTRVDHADRKIYIDRSKDEVRSAPDYSDDPAVWEKLTAYYGRR